MVPDSLTPCASDFTSSLNPGVASCFICVNRKTLNLQSGIWPTTTSKSSLNPGDSHTLPSLCSLNLLESALRCFFIYRSLMLGFLLYSLFWRVGLMYPILVWHYNFFYMVITTTTPLLSDSHPLLSQLHSSRVPSLFIQHFFSP